MIRQLAVSALLSLPLLAQVTAPVPAPKSVASPAAKPAPVPSVKDLKFPPLGPIQTPKIEQFTLANGMRVYLLEDHELPIVNGTALVRTGNLFDPKEKIGLAGITGTVMRSGGTKQLTGDQIDVQLENIAASVEAGIGETSGSVSFSSMKETAPQVMAIFHDVLTAPEFRQDRIDLVKTQIRSSIARRNDSAHGIAGREFSDIIYGRGTPYGWRSEYATIDAISRPDLQQFYQRYFFPANVMLAVRGDFQTAEMKARLEKLFADWTVTQPAVPAFPKVEASAQPGTFLGVKKDVTQTFFVVGHLGGQLNDPDYAALSVMADILGGGFRSRLMQRIRTRMGAAYSIGANWGASYDHAGTFEISGSTKSMSTVETLRAVREELERIRNTEVTAEELQTAKDSALNSLVFAFDTKAKTLGRILTYEYFGYPRDFIDRYQKALAAVTARDVQRVARQHIKPENLTIVAVGNPADFGTGLEALGAPVTPLDLTIPSGKKATATAASEPSRAAGMKMLQTVQKAVGGVEKLLAVKDSVVSMDVTVEAANNLKVKQTDLWIAPSQLRQESVMPAGRITAYTDGESGWIATPQGGGPLGGPQLKQVQGDLFRNYVRMLAADKYGYGINLLADDSLELSDANGQIARLRIDGATGLPTALTYESIHATGEPIVVEETYGGFQAVSGILYPRKVTIQQGGHKFADVAVTEVRINGGLKPEEVSARPR